MKKVRPLINKVTGVFYCQAECPSITWECRGVSFCSIDGERHVDINREFTPCTQVQWADPEWIEAERELVEA